MLDVLGTLTGAAFLAGSVALALLVDRREAAGSGQRSGAGAPASSLASPVDAHRLRLVPGTDR